jgi:lipopolysaccharide export system permease protein
MNKILNRYLLKEISFPFGLILMILTFVLLLGKSLSLMDLMVNKGVPFTAVAELISFLMPSLLVYTIPISLLISILVGVGRLSNDNEITVMKSSGISLYQLCVPVLAFSFAASLVTALMLFFLVPEGNIATRNLLFNIVQQKATVGIKEKVFNDDFPGILIYTDRIPPSGDYLEGVIISDRRTGQEPSTIIAKRAYLVSDTKNLSLNLRLESGISCSTESRQSNYKQMIFKNYDINLNMGLPLSDTGGKNTREMTFHELVSNLKQSDLKDKDIRELMTELYRKFTFPFSCLIFALMGLPLAIRPQRSSKSGGFVVGLFIILTYFFLQRGSDALVEMGKLSPILGAGGTTVLFLATGIWLFIRAAQEN